MMPKPYLVAICRENVWDITRFSELAEAAAYADHYGMQWSLVYVFRILVDIDPIGKPHNNGPRFGFEQFAVITAIDGVDDIVLAYDLHEARAYYDLRTERNLDPVIVQALSGPSTAANFSRQ